MKKNCLLFFFAFVIGIMLLTGCDKKLETTNLSNIYLDNMTIGMKINKDDLTNYTDSDRYSYDYKYMFEEIVIDTNDDDEINYLFARFDEDYIEIKVNDKSLNKIEDVQNVLGNNYQNKNYDREQQLKEYVYKDNDRNIKAEFVYSTNDNSLYWIILSKN
jgi:hypothetical protein